MERRPALLAGLLVAFSIAASPALAQTVDEGLRKDIEKLLEVTGSSKMGLQMATMVSGQMLDGLLQQQDVPPKAIELAKEVVNDEIKKAFEAPDGLNTDIVAVYAKHFTHDEVRGLLAFYDTPLGQKMIAATPALFQESVAVGQSWAQRIAPRIKTALDERLRAEGYIK